MFRDLFLLSFAFWLEPTLGFYSKVVNGHKLNGGIFSLLLKQDWLSCTIACASNNNCVSYNYKRGPLKEKSTPEGFCELSNIGASFHTSKFTKQSAGDMLYADGWVFHQMRPYKDVGVENESMKNRSVVSSATDGLELSAILSLNSKYLRETRNFLPDHIQNNNSWTLCWRSDVHGWIAKTYHRNCDNKGIMLTLIQVETFVFGAHIEKPCTGSDDYIKTTSSFLFSLKNKDNLRPFKMLQKSHGTVAVCKMTYGPTFGHATGRYDICIALETPMRRTSQTDPGHSFKLPTGYIPESAKARSLLAGSYYFKPNKIEVFWKT